MKSRFFKLPNAQLLAAAIVLLCGCSDPDGLRAIEKSFASNPGTIQKSKATGLIQSARTGNYFAAVSGLQTLRLDPTLTLDQLTAIQDAIGKIQSRLANEAAHGNNDALRHVRALQGETEPIGR